MVIQGGRNVFTICRVLTFAVGILAVTTLLPATGRAADPSPPEKVPILLDTDIGSDVDDAFALALALASPEVDLVGVTTVGQGAEDRAWMVCRFLTAVGRRDVPVAWGRDPQPESPIEGLPSIRFDLRLSREGEADKTSGRVGSDPSAILKEKPAAAAS